MTPAPPTGRSGRSPTARPRPPRVLRNLNAKIASVPMILTALVVFMGGTAWTVAHSFTKSRLLPKWKFVGFDQYERLWSSNRWLISVENQIGRAHV